MLSVEILSTKCLIEGRKPDKLFITNNTMNCQWLDEIYKMVEGQAPLPVLCLKKWVNQSRVDNLFLNLVL